MPAQRQTVVDSYPDPKLFEQPDVPIGTALDLARVPIVLATGRRAGIRDVAEQGDSDTGDQLALETLPVLPRELWQRHIRLQDRRNKETIITVEGQPSLGLAYGGDYDVLLALFYIIEQDRERVRAGLPAKVENGEFIGITVLDIAMAMGYTRAQLQGTLRNRIRSALRRFSYTRITTRSQVLFDGAALAGQLRKEGLSPDHAPVAPAQEKRFVETEESVTWLLEYNWRMDHSRGTPEVWIKRLRINPVFLDQVATGWIAWIEPKRYDSLSSTLARRLYAVYAADVAMSEGVKTHFEHSVDVLAARLGLPPGWPAYKTVQSLKQAAKELVKAGLLASAEVIRLHKDAFLSASAGPPMFFAGYLRGMSILDEPSDRVLFVFLRFFGIQTAEARQLIYDHPYHTREALRWAVYTFDTAPESVTKNWAGFIRERIQAKRTTAGDVRFAQWYARQIASADRVSPPSDTDAVETAKQTEVENTIRREPAKVIVRTSEADDLLEAAKKCDMSLDPIQLAYARNLLAYAIVGETLVAVTQLLLSRGSESVVVDALSQVLTRLSDGRITALRIDPYDPAIHAGAAPPEPDGLNLVSKI